MLPPGFLNTQVRKRWEEISRTIVLVLDECWQAFTQNTSSLPLDLDVVSCCAVLLYLFLCVLKLCVALFAEVLARLQVRLAPVESFRFSLESKVKAFSRSAFD